MLNSLPSHVTPLAASIVSTSFQIVIWVAAGVPVESTNLPPHTLESISSVTSWLEAFLTTTELSVPAPIVAVIPPVTVNVVPLNVKLASAFASPCVPVEVNTLLLPKLVIVALPEVPELPELPDVPELPDEP